MTNNYYSQHLNYVIEETTSKKYLDELYPCNLFETSSKIEISDELFSEDVVDEEEEGAGGRAQAAGPATESLNLANSAPPFRLSPAGMKTTKLKREYGSSTSNNVKTIENESANYSTHNQIRYRCFACDSTGITWIQKHTTMCKCPECGCNRRELSVNIMPSEGRCDIDSMWRYGSSDYRSTTRAPKLELRVPTYKMDYGHSESTSKRRTSKRPKTTFLEVYPVPYESLENTRIRCPACQYNMISTGETKILKCSMCGHDL